MAEPTGGGVHVDITKLRAKIKAVLAVFSAREILTTIGEREKTAMGLVLQSAGSDGGEGRWKEMAPITLQRRPLRPSSHHFSSPYQTLLQQSPVAEVQGETSVAVFTGAKYAVYHHFGSEDGHLPARPLLPSEETAHQAALEVIDAMLQKVSQAGRA
jgi:hypothetical protein